MGELERKIKWFKKYKSPRQDGQTIELYISFFDIVGQDIRNVVEEWKIIGRMYEVINSTFISLIPKVNCHMDLVELNSHVVIICNEIWVIGVETLEVEQVLIHLSYIDIYMFDTLDLI